VPNTQVRAGMTTAASIITEVRQDVLLVPSGAVKSSTDGSRYVEVLDDGAPQRVSIEAGLTDGTSTEVVSGLKAGQEVVTQTTGGSTTATTARQNGGFGLPSGGPPGRGGVFMGPGPGE
jgi:multidrug efflux pump subunit AcrA (membrane-fusion protein)